MHQSAKVDLDASSKRVIVRGYQDIPIRLLSSISTRSLVQNGHYFKLDKKVAEHFISQNED